MNHEQFQVAEDIQGFLEKAGYMVESITIADDSRSSNRGKFVITAVRR